MVKVVLVAGTLTLIGLVACSDAPPFTCGQSGCDPNTSYCLVSVSGLHGIPTSFECQPLPDGCHSCDCLDAIGSHPSCDTCCGCHDHGGDLTVYASSCTP
jgi:hypothetical protein